MTKQNELAWIDRAITELGPHSYLGPWLADNRLSLERDIRDDFSPNAMMPWAAHREAQAIIADARHQAEEIIKAAEKRRDELHAQGRSAAERLRQQAIDALHAVIARL